MTRPFVHLKAAMSLDGCLDDAGPTRLVLSSEADRTAVDALRAKCDAILIGAETLRKDDPALQIRDAAHVQARVARGQPPQPCRIVLTRTGDLPASHRFFAPHSGEAWVYAPTAQLSRLQPLGALATLRPLPAGDEWLAWLLADLHARGVRRLLVEGGAQVHQAFLRAKLFDALRLAVAPVLVADERAPRLFAGHLAPLPAGHLRLSRSEVLGNTTVLHLEPIVGGSAKA